MNFIQTFQVLNFSPLFRTDRVYEKFEFQMKDGLNFCVALRATDLREQRVHIVFSQREFTHVTWSRVPEPLLSAILVVCMGFYMLYFIFPYADCGVSAGCVGALTDSNEGV